MTKPAQAQTMNLDDDLRARTRAAKRALTCAANDLAAILRRHLRAVRAATRVVATYPDDVDLDAALTSAMRAYEEAVDVTMRLDRAARSMAEAERMKRLAIRHARA